VDFRFARNPKLLRLRHTAHRAKMQRRLELRRLASASAPLVGVFMAGQISLASPAAPRLTVDKGLAAAGSAENHFLARTDDGRAVRLLQIERRTKRGTQAWLPDGTLVPSKERMHLRYSLGRRSDLLYFIFRFVSPSPTNDIDGSDANREFMQRLGGIRRSDNYILPKMTGKVNASEPDVEYFAGSSVEQARSKRPGSRIVVNCIRIPAIGRGATDSYQFQWADGPWSPLKRIGIVRPCDEPVNALGVFREALDVRSPSRLKFALCDDEKSWTGPSDGALPKETAPYQFAKLSFPSTYLGRLELFPRATDVSGRTIDGNGGGEGYGQECWEVYGWPEPFQKLSLIEIEGRMVEYADFLDVRLRPNRPERRRF